MYLQARPPGIYKKDYLDELAGRYANGDIGSTFIVTPALPDWCDDVESGREGVRLRSKGEEEKVRRRGMWV